MKISTIDVKIIGLKDGKDNLTKNKKRYIYYNMKNQFWQIFNLFSKNKDIISFGSFCNPNYSIQDQYLFLKTTLDIEDYSLASYLGLSLNSIDKVSNNTNISNKKQLRLENLFLLLFNLEFSYARSFNIKSFINNERIIIDPMDEEDGDISVLNYIITQKELIKEIPTEIIKLIEQYNIGEL